MDKYFEKIPIVIGTTGHIDIDEPEFMREKVEFFFYELKKQLKNTPVILISSMADGADTIFVEAGFKVYNNNIKLIAPLPFSKEKLEKTLSNKEKFLYYCNRAKIIDISKEIKDENAPAEEHYALASEYIIKNSNLLFALYDGKEAKDENNMPKKGGTYDTVLKCLNQNYVELINSNIKYPKSIPVIQLVSKRKKFTDKNKDFGNFICHFPNGTKEKYENDFLKLLDKNGFSYGKTLKNIEKFNILIEKYKNNPKTEISKNYLLNEKTRYSLNNSINNLINIYAICDFVALKKQKSYEIKLFSLFSMICITVLYSNFIGNFNVFFSIFAIIMLLFWKSISGEKEHLDLRFIAETLRVLVFWKISGIKEKISKYILSNEDGDIIWIKASFSNYELNELFSKEENIKPDFKLVHDEWLENQAEYYKKTSKKCEINDKKLDTIKYGILSVFLVLHFIFGISLILKTDISFLTYSIRESLCKIFLCLGLFTFPSATYVQSQKAWLEHQELYSKTGKLFELVKRQFSKTQNTTMKEKLILDISKFALSEEESWFLLHRRRKAEPAM